jgi:methionyl-tRNA formyltransferase
VRVLFLGPPESPLRAWLESRGETVIATAEKITPAFLDEHRPELLVSYGYRYILRGEILDRFPGRAVNLHISLLPWNRGADPNLWSFVEDTPKGVTIHHLDRGVDTGDIIAQREIAFAAGDTLRSSYERLQREIQELFHLTWPDIRAGTAPRRPQVGAGTSHRLRDKELLLPRLSAGWDTPVAELPALAR